MDKLTKAKRCLSVLVNPPMHYDHEVLAKWMGVEAGVFEVEGKHPSAVAIDELSKMIVEDGK